MSSYRPLYHFLPPSNWINDPNGLIDWKGQYHLFYQYNPEFPDFGVMLWGHATSRDLVHWEHLPVALHADTPFDKDGCWTGCAVDNDGVPSLIYTGKEGEKENVCLAVSHDDLKTFTKPGMNRLNVFPPEDKKLAGFRDPYVWREKDGWSMVVGSGFEGKGGAVLLYRSQNLLDWDYQGPLLAAEDDRIGTMWECPNFFPLGDKHVLIVSVFPLGCAQYFVGPYSNGLFIPEKAGTFDFGKYFYAPQVFKDHKQRTIIFGWIWEGLTQEARMASSWAGMQSLPRELFLSADGSLCNRPVEEVTSLRLAQTALANLTLEEDIDYMAHVVGGCLEIDVRFSSITGKAGVGIACSEDNQEQTRVGYDSRTRRVFIDRDQSSLSPDAQKEFQEASLDLAADEELKLHIFLDRSVIEVFANDRISLTSRIYPIREDSLGVRLFAKHGEAKVKSLQVWNVKSIEL